MEELHLGTSHGRYRGWQRVCAPSSEDNTLNDQDDAFVVQFAACALEDLRVGFASSPPRGDDGEDQSKRGFQWRYELILGGNGNTEVQWRKFLPAIANKPPKELVLAQRFAGRTCSTTAFVNYWVLLSAQTLVVGIGETIGTDVLLCVSDPQWVSVDAAAFATWESPATIRQIAMARHPAASFMVSAMPQQIRPIVRADPWGKEDVLTSDQRAEYEKLLQSTWRRVERFGGEFHVPDVRKLMDAKVIRQMQRTGAVGAAGFTTGIDLLSQEERAKREERMKRFQTPEFAVDFSTDTARAVMEDMTQEAWQAKEEEQRKRQERAERFGLDPTAVQVDSAQAKAKMNLRAASSKVRSERCDVPSTDSMESVPKREDAIHMYSLDEQFQQVRTRDVMEYFSGYGPWYVEWINDSSCTIVFEDAFTAKRALTTLSEELVMPKASMDMPEPNSAETPTAGPVVDEADKPMDGEDVEMADADVEMEEAQAPESTQPEPEQQLEDAPASGATKNKKKRLSKHERLIEDVTSMRASGWRYGLPITSATQPRHKSWRVLLRTATEQDFPPEKEKKYHERSYGANRDQSRRRNASSRHHPYQASSSRRRGRRDQR